MRSLTIDRLTPNRISQAYTIIQMALPELTLEAWNRYARTLLTAEQSDCGIVVVNNEQGYIVGLAVYRTQQDLRDNRIMVVDHLVAVDLIRQESIAQALAEALETLAHKTRCNALHTCLPEEKAEPATHWLSDLMAARGHCVSKRLMRKPLAR